MVVQSNVASSATRLSTSLSPSDWRLFAAFCCATGMQLLHLVRDTSSLQLAQALTRLALAGACGVGVSSVMTELGYGQGVTMAAVGLAGYLGGAVLDAISKEVLEIIDSISDRMRGGTRHE